MNRNSFKIIKMKSKLLLISICLANTINIFSQEDVVFQKLEKRIPASTIPASGIDFAKYDGNSSAVSLPVPLLSIGGVNVQLEYSSQGINQQVRTENQYAPSGSIGLGWSLSIGSISAEINNSADESDDRYFYTGPDGNFEIKEDENGAFLVPDGKPWKIQRIIDRYRISGWVITKEDGTVYRYGNFHRINGEYTFSLSNDSAFATRFYLGYHGLVTNPAPSVYNSMDLIPYQWDLSDIRDIYDNHTKIVYNPELEFLSVGSTATSLQYTRESHPHKILDNRGNSVEFEFDSMESAAEYPSYPNTYTQNLVEKKYLKSISIYGDVIGVIGELVKKITFNHQVSDILGTNIIKRYLTGFTINDKNNNTLPSFSFNYYGFNSDTGINPGAIKDVIDPREGQVTYTYKTQTLSDVTLSKTEEVGNIDYWKLVPGTAVVNRIPSDDGLAGNKFVCVRTTNNILHIYRRGPKGWYNDTIFPVESSVQVRVYNDYISYWQNKSAMVARLLNDNWVSYNLSNALAEATNTTIKYSRIIGVYSNYCVVKYNPDVTDAVLDGTPEEWPSCIKWKVAIANFTPTGLKIFQLQNRDDDYYWDGVSLEDQEKRTEIQAFCGQNYLILESFSDCGGTPRISQYRFSDVRYGWQTLVDREIRSDFTITDIPNVSIGKNYIVFATKNKIIIYRHTGPDLEVLEDFYYNPDSSPGYVVADDYYAYTVYLSEPAYGYKEGIVVKTWNGESFSSAFYNEYLGGRYALSSVGNRLVYSWTDYGTETRKIAYIKHSSSGWSSPEIIETVSFGTSDCDWRTIAMSISSNAFAAMWYRKWSPDLNYEPIPTAINIYTFNDNSVSISNVDAVSQRSALINNKYGYEDVSLWTLQPGNNFLALSRPDIYEYFGSDPIHIYSYVTNANGAIQASGHPEVIVLDHIDVNNGSGDSYSSQYTFEKGVHNESLNSAFNKVTDAISGSGKTVNYFYNDLDAIDAEDFISALNFKELDGFVYKSVMYNETNVPVQTTKNYWSGQEINSILGIYFKRLDSKETELDGVTTSTEYTYNSINHLPSETIEHVYATTSSGSNKDKITQVTYAFENNTSMNKDGAHMLVQPYETRVYESGITNPVSGSRTVYRATYPFVPTETYQLDGGDWLKTSSNILYDTKGNIIQSTDANSNPSSVIWGYNSALPVAQILNAKTSSSSVGSQASYTGFETGAVTDGTNPNEDYWSLYPGQTASTDAHTGKYSWQVPAGNPVYGPTRDFLPPDDNSQTKTYILSCWVKTESGFGGNKGTLLLHTKANTDVNTVYPDVEGAFKPVTFGDTGGEWKYIETEIDLAAIKDEAGMPGITLRIRAYIFNTDPNKYFLVDDIRFHPKDAVMQTFTYDPVTSLVTSQSDPNNNPAYFEYDGFGRPTATRNSDNLIVNFNNYPNPTTVNTTIKQSPNPDGFIQNFVDGFGKKLRQSIHTELGEMITRQEYTKGQLHIEHQPSGYATEYIYSSDLLNRIEKQGGYGSSVWNNTTGRHTSFSYGTNSGTEAGYSANKLFKTLVTDENGKVRCEYKDLSGNVVESIENVVPGTGAPDVDNLTTKFQYDILGNLKKSTPPKGDGYATTYNYNTLGRLTDKHSPDAGTVSYIYDKNGNLRFIRDANQLQNGKYSYNKYDGFNRVIERGEYNSSANFDETTAYIKNFPSASYTLIEQLYYDYPRDGMEQNNVKGKLAKSISCRQGTAICTTYYSYNPSGWVEWVLYKMPGSISDKKISYVYNLQGKVTKKCVSDLSTSTLYTFYTYDMAGRLKYVYTNTTDSQTGKVKEAEYTYNADGTIKRLQLANAQGVDYTYNERNWLTQINHQNLNSTDDPGHDGTNGVAADIFGEVIGYNDRGHITDERFGFSFQPQFNGNISWSISRTKQALLEGAATSDPEPVIGFSYNYDGINRLTKADFGYWQPESSSWVNEARYDLPLINYDANGNIEYLQRNGVDGTVIDNFDYIYQGTNKLESITGRGSYTYDYNGNMLTDTYKGISGIIYNSSNLPEQLTVGSTTVNYWYNADGQRIRKQADGVDEIYVYGVDGQTEAVFDATGSLKFFNINTGAENIGRLEAVAYELRLSNVTLSGIYTANNIIAETNVNVTGTTQLKAGVSVTLKPGFRAAEGCSLVVSIDTTLVVEPEKYYYVKDHLGSTRVTVDEEGEIASYYDYDPWGMVLDGRSGNNGIANEKYKFTGKERDDETNYDYFGARYYDGRIGRWLGVDPLAEKYPGWSPYNYCVNNPLNLIDPDGAYVSEFEEMEKKLEQSKKEANKNEMQNNENKDKSKTNEKENLIILGLSFSGAIVEGINLEVGIVIGTSSGDARLFAKGGASVGGGVGLSIEATDQWNSSLEEYESKNGFCKDNLLEIEASTQAGGLNLSVNQVTGEIREFGFNVGPGTGSGLMNYTNFNVMTPRTNLIKSIQKVVENPLMFK